MTNILGNPTLGFQSYGRMEGGSPTAGMTPAWIASTDASLIFRGDPIITSSAPGTNQSGAYITSVQLTSPASGFLCRGIFQGMEQYNPTVGRTIWSNFYNGVVTGSTGDVRCWIIDDPDQLFIVQASTKGAISSSFVGLNVGITFNTSTGNTTTGYSNNTVESSAIGSTNSLPFRIVALYSDYAPPGGGAGNPNINSSVANALVNGTDNNNVANIIVVRLNNCDRLSLTSRSA